MVRLLNLPFYLGLLLLASSVVNTIVDNGVDQLQLEIDEYHKALVDQMTAEIGEATEKVLKITAKNYCTGFKAFKDTEIPAYVKAFAEGPCNPAVFLPGVAGSKLIVELDCKELSKHSEIMSYCRWNGCSGKDAPNKHYKIWIPKVGSSMSIAGMFQPNNNRCFSKLFGIRNDVSTNKLLTTEHPGVKIITYGEAQDDSDYSDSDCGFESIINLLPLPDMLQLGFQYFRDLKLQFESLGYKAGITMQALPYDFRKAPDENDLGNSKQKFKNTLTALNKITGKGVVIVAHSMGNFQTVHNLWKMDQATKDKLVSKYIAIAPPYMGSPEAVGYAFGLDKGFNFKADMGLTPQDFKDVINNMPSTFVLMSKPTFSLMTKQPWYAELRKRMDADEQMRSYKSTDKVIGLFPSHDEKCQHQLKHRDNNCIIGIKDVRNVVTIGREVFTEDKIEEALKKYSYAPHASYMYNKYSDMGGFHELKHPGVPTVIIYGNIIDTPLHVKWDSDPRSTVNQGKFYPPDDVEYGMGDGTVHTASALLPGIKWAHDFLDKVPGSKPVHLIELCSEVNRRTAVYDDRDSDKITDNAVYGINCECRGKLLFKSKGGDCDHMHMVMDPNLVEFVANSAQDNKKGNYKGSVQAPFSTWTQSDWDNYVKGCKMYNP